jgi:hypothetical protein
MSGYLKDTLLVRTRKVLAHVILGAGDTALVFVDDAVFVMTAP